jgi:drug/metabolite transporter (DMT)-like permease
VTSGPRGAAAGAGLLATVIGVTLWGIQLPIGKDAFAVIDPFHVTLIRYAIGAVLLVLTLLWLEGWRALRYEGRARDACLIGFVGMSISPVLTFIGMGFSRAEHTVVIVTLQPMITVIAQWFTQRRRPARFTLVCIGTAFVGVVMVVTQGRFFLAESGREILGDVLALGGAACWVFYTMGIGRLAGWSALRVTTLTLLPGVCGTAIFTTALVAAGFGVHPTFEQMGSVFWLLAYLGVGGVFLSMIAWIYGTQRIGPFNAALLVNLMPVVAFGVRAIQGHRIEPVELLGAAIVVMSLVASNLYLRARLRSPG